MKSEGMKIFWTIVDCLAGIATFVYALLMAFDVVSYPSAREVAIIAFLAISLCFIDAAEKKLNDQ